MPLNLVQHRAGPSIWDRSEQMQWDGERWLAGVLAGALFVSGLRRRSAAGLALAIAGGCLAWWAAAGTEERHQVRGRLRRVWPLTRPADWVGEASEESFPASDAPSWTPTTGSGAWRPDGTSSH